MTKKDRQFVETVWQFYRDHGRHDLPWRHTAEPYKIVVSELMLQQTQVERVIPKYQAFIKRWSNVHVLSTASLGDVLMEWQGLGYNRRAKLLHLCAQTVAEHNNRWPQTFSGLVDLPGIGPYTAGAVMAFAFNKPVPIIETNIRTVYLHHYFSNTRDVNDKDITPVISRTLDQTDPRSWYAALMDYGSYLKKQYKNPSRRSKHHTQQSAFRGSDREIRGALIKVLAAHGPSTTAVINQMLDQHNSKRIHTQLKALEKEALITFRNQRYSLPS
jgi:A/G-specific adenine glycosylase